jgi:light-regulated signal transduction histidine kinase (bacteriophytochrome)
MIVSYAQLLERRYQQHLDQDGREFMGYIDDAVQRMELLLSDLLNYSRQTGIPTEPPSRVDAELALQDALSRLERAVEDNGAQVTHDALPHVMFDFDRLTQLFRQLISNSIKFRGPEPPRTHISAADTGHEVIFAVQDNGIGIDPRYHDQIFGMFKRLHGRQYPGSGIGLAICKRIVEQYGGRIWVESEAGQGAIVRFALPK